MRADPKQTAACCACLRDFFAAIRSALGAAYLDVIVKANKAESGMHPQQVRQVRILLVPLGAAFLVIGFLFTFDNLSYIAQHDDSVTWRSVQGRVIKSKQTDAYVADVRFCPKPDIEYEFYVDDTQFRSRRISFSKMVSCDREYTRRILLEYPASKAVSVFYNPSDPSQAVLKKDGLSGAYWGAALGLVFALIGGTLVYGLLVKLSSG